MKTITEDAAPNTPIMGGAETKPLVVEDEPVLREMAQMMEECGYRVFLAQRQGSWIKNYGRHQNSIDLLFTDMVMPLEFRMDLRTRCWLASKNNCARRLRQRLHRG